MTALASSESVYIDETQQEYLEYHHQVNFDDLDVFLVDGKTLDIAISGNVRSRQKSAAERDIDILMTALSDYKDIKDEFIATMTNNEQLAAISFTEAPLIWVDDHYERVLASNEESLVDSKAGTRSSSSSSSSKKGKFSLWTSVVRDYSALSNGQYKYTTRTNGAWSENSFVGGTNYPASGNDYVLQSTPNTWTRKSHSMTAQYDNNPRTGVSGTDFWAENGSTNYIRYVILDDPFGIAQARQNKSFALSCVSEGPAASTARMINSYYVHTWSKITISASISASSSKEVALSITPSKTTDQWQLYNYISFNF
ncbi:MAG: hypothetical protein FWC20_10170 [Oscillospiraceae bacterium]|nr:hypothetical protein [Oscillospiraceae bacterium]